MGKNKKAFTLIEVMVVMAIIAVLAVLIIGAITIARRTATETTHRSNAKAVQTGMEGMYARNKAYPVYAAATACSTVAAAFSPALTLATGASTLGACAAGGVAVGGCSVVSTTTTYTITPYDYACTAGGMGASDQLTVN